MKSVLLSFVAMAVMGISLLSSMAFSQRVWIMGSNVILRAEPNRKSKEVARLQYWDTFLVKEQSEHREVIDIGEQCDQWGYPWVHVVNASGLEGWVYGRYCYAASSETPLKSRFSDGRKVSLIFATDFSQGPSDDEGLTGCETFTLVLVQVEGAAIPVGVRMGEFRHLNPTRGYEAGKTPPVLDWLLLTTDDGCSQELTAMEVLDFDGQEAIQLRMTVGYQDGQSENVLTLLPATDGHWELVDYLMGEVHSNTD